MVDSTVDSIKRSQSSIHIDKENVKQRISQAVGTTKNLNTCMEKYNGEIEKYIADLETVNQKCVDTAVVRLGKQVAEGESKLMRPVGEFNKKVELHAMKCLDEISTKPNCVNDIVEPGRKKLAVFKTETETFLGNVAITSVKATDCFLENSKEYQTKLVPLANKVKVCTSKN